MKFFATTRALALVFLTAAACGGVTRPVHGEEGTGDAAAAVSAGGYRTSPRLPDNSDDFHGNDDDDASPCEDVPGFYLDGKKFKHCEWAARAPIRRCRKVDADSGVVVRNACPSVCNIRCRCVNYKRSFHYDGERISCRIVKLRDCNDKTAHSKKLVSDRCPKKCKTCYPSIEIRKRNRKRNRV